MTKQNYDEKFMAGFLSDDEKHYGTSLKRNENNSITLILYKKFKTMYNIVPGDIIEIYFHKNHQYFKLVHIKDNDSPIGYKVGSSSTLAIKQKYSKHSEIIELNSSLTKCILIHANENEYIFKIDNFVNDSYNLNKEQILTEEFMNGFETFNDIAYYNFISLSRRTNGYFHLFIRNQFRQFAKLNPGKHVEIYFHENKPDHVLIKKCNKNKLGSHLITRNGEIIFKKETKSEIQNLTERRYGHLVHYDENGYVIKLNNS